MEQFVDFSFLVSFYRFILTCVFHLFLQQFRSILMNRELMKERGKEMNFKEKFRDRGFFFLFFFFQWLYSVSLKKARFRVERKSFDTSNGA